MIFSGIDMTFRNGVSRELKLLDVGLNSEPEIGINALLSFSSSRCSWKVYLFLNVEYDFQKPFELWKRSNDE